MEDPGSQEILLEVILLIVLTLLNAFFSATEMSMVSLNRSRVEQKAEEGDKKYIRLLSVLEQPNHFLSTIQVGITLITILSGASLADSLGHVIAGWMGNTKTALAAEGTTIIITTHFMEEAEYCDRIMIQDQGKMLILGTPQEVREKAGKDIKTMNQAFIEIIGESRSPH